MCEEPSNGSGGEPRDLVGVVVDICRDVVAGFVVTMGGGFGGGAALGFGGTLNCGAGSLGWEEDGVGERGFLGVSGNAPGRTVFGCSGVTAARVRETDSVVVCKRADTAETSGSWSLSDDEGESAALGKCTG